jgi:ribosomal protein L11 methyltransferase
MNRTDTAVVKIRRPKDQNILDLWLAHAQGTHGFQGIHEGSVLAEEAHELGLETESWVIDQGLAPHFRDWILDARKDGIIDIYFETMDAAHVFLDQAGIEKNDYLLEKIQTEDWNAKWRESFQGIEISDEWVVYPPWKKDEKNDSSKRIIWINPGAGFGTGTHETTQGCLRFLFQIAELRLETEKSGRLNGQRVLDFGSGSGILAIAAGVLGAQVDAVEIDLLAIDNAVENSKLNQVENQVRYLTDLQDKVLEGQQYDVVLANILRPILLDFSAELMKKTRLGGTLIFSGLIESDVPLVLEAYDALAKARGEQIQSQVLSLNEWRAILIQLNSGLR